MRVSKENIYMNRIVCKNTLQIILDDDFNVPDNKEDIENIVKEWGNVRVDSVKASGDKADINGCMDFALLYTGRNRSDAGKVAIVSMTGAMNYTESVNLSENADNATLSCKARIEDLSIKAVNSRKISVKAVISLEVVVEEIEEISPGTELIEEQSEDKVQVLQGKMNYSRTAVSLHDNLRIRETASIGGSRPSIGSILWNDVQIYNLNSRLTDEGIDISGELGILVMYMPYEEGESVQYYENSISFDGKIDINGCNPDMVSCLAYSLMSKNVEVKADSAGENRELLIELVLDMTVRAYEECEKNVIADMYSPVKNISLTTERLTYKHLVVHNTSKARVSERVKVSDKGSILQICNISGVAQKEDVTVTPEGILVDGVVLADVMYMQSSDMAPLGCMKVSFPFSQTVQAELSQDAEVNIEVSVDRLTAVMLGEGEIEVKGNVLIDAVVLEMCETVAVTDCDISDYSEDEYLAMPCMVGYIASGEDTMWEVAKRYHTTTECIRKQNGTVAERLADTSRIKRGEKLMIVKSCR